MVLYQIISCGKDLVSLRKVPRPGEGESIARGGGGGWWRNMGNAVRGDSLPSPAQPLDG